MLYGGLFWIGFLIGGCDSPTRSPILEDLKLGGIRISAKTLRGGQEIYDANCRRCHGEDGDGKGPLGRSQNPPAADFRKGFIKYASVAAESLPTDADFQRSMRHGLKGTAMLKTGLGDAQLHQVTQYLKTLSPRWKDERAGLPLEIQPNPFGAQEEKQIAVRKGPGLSLKAGCATCHGKKILNLQTGGLKTGDSPEALYRVIAAGVGGTGMKPQAGRLSNEEIWALVEWIRGPNKP